MRTVTTHIANPLNDKIVIEVLDRPGAGGANHEYVIHLPTEARGVHETYIQFQKGPIGEKGINGISQEALLAICIDRLQCFQKGDFACRENAIALTKMEEAMHWLHHRTRARVDRGVEGKTIK